MKFKHIGQTIKEVNAKKSFNPIDVFVLILFNNTYVETENLIVEFPDANVGALNMSPITILNACVDIHIKIMIRTQECAICVRDV